jgi:hypothetical protein
LINGFVSVTEFISRCRDWVKIKMNFLKVYNFKTNGLPNIGAGG